jgi:diguanylate cyclase (GGDEF)-like protein/PAS domain S-box-containing protein
MEAAQSAYQDSSRLIRLLSILGRPGSPEELVDEGLTALSEVFQADVTAVVRWVGDRLVVTASCGLPEDDAAFTTGWIPSPSAADVHGSGRALTGPLPDVEPGRAASNEAASNEAASNEAASNEAASNEAASNEAASNEAASNEAVASETVALRALGMASAVWLPLSDDAGRTDHLLVLYRRRQEPFSSAELALLGSVARRLLISVQSRRRAAAAELLARSGHLLPRQRDEMPLLAEATALLLDLLSAQRAAAFLIRDGRARRVGGAGAATGMPSEPFPVADDLSAEDLPGWSEVSEAGVPILLDDGSVGDAGTWLVVPAVADPTTSAMVYAGWLDLPPLMSPVTETAAIFAATLTAALTNVTLYRALSASEASLRQITDSVSDLIAVVDSGCRINYASAAYDRAVALDPRSLVGRSILDLVGPEDRTTVRDAVLGAISRSAPTAIEYRLRGGDGQAVWVESVLRPAETPDRSVVMSTRLVEERKRREEELRHQAAHDPLTGLANRTSAMVHLERALAAARSGDVGLLFCDLDRFKPVNDLLGHAAGDDLLRQVAGRLRECTRSDDVIARLGGDEFVFILDGVNDVAEIEEIRRRIIAALEHPFRLGDEQVQISVSVGIAVGVRRQAAAADLLEAADSAMYAAKRRRHQQAARL